MSPAEVQWVEDGCRAAREAHDAGYREEAAEILAHVERVALGKRLRGQLWRARVVAEGCSVADCDRPRRTPYQRLCSRHQRELVRRFIRLEPQRGRMW